MRQILLRLLLLSVFFNTAFAMPLHQAGHARHAAEAVALEHAGHGDDEPRSPDGHGEIDAPCAECTGFAQQGHALGTSPARTQPGASPRAAAIPAAPMAFVPAPIRWPFASRDPPL